MSETRFINLPILQAAELIADEVVSGSITGELIDRYSIPLPGGAKVLVLVFEKHYYRAGNRLTLTVTLDDVEGDTRIHYIGGGGSQSVLMRFDWGAAGSFMNVVEDAIRPYLIYR